MNSRLDKSMVRDLALAIGLSAALIALLLACAAESAPPMAAAPPAARTAVGELGPAWTSTDPVTRIVQPDTTWFIEPYGVTITFKEGALRETAIFTFTPRPDLPLDPPLASTGYLFDFSGTLVSTGRPVSLWKAIRYTLQYEEAELRNVSEHTLEVYRYSDWWIPQNADVDTTANRITWETAFTGKFGVGGYGPRAFIYVPATFNSGTVRATQAGQPTD